MVLRACLGAGALALLLVTSGCSDDPQPRVEPTVDSPAPSPTETTSAEPAAWEVKSKAGAVAFAKHWIEALSESLTAGDTARMAELSSATCSICDDFAGRVHEIKQAGGFIRSEGWRVLSVAEPQYDSTSAIVPMRIREGAETVRETARANPVRHPPATATWSAEMTWSSGEWRISDFRLVE